MKTFSAILSLMLTTAALGVAAELAPVAAPQTPSQDGRRYLFLLDTSATMARNKENIEKTVRDLVASGMNGEINPGDAFAIWPYRDKVVTDAFVPETWVPQLKDSLADSAGQFVSGIKYQGSSLFYVALVEGFKVLRASKAATLVLISEGTEMIQGTPFDVYANTIYRDHASQLRKEKKPFVTILVAIGGKIIGCTVGSGGDPITMPPIPEESKQWLAAEFAEARAARKEVIAATPPKPVPAPNPATVKPSITKAETLVLKAQPLPKATPPAPAPVPAPAPPVNPAPLPAPPAPPAAPTQTPAAQTGPTPVAELPTQQVEQKSEAAGRESLANTVPARSLREPQTPTPTAEQQPQPKQLGLAAPAAAAGRTRMLLIGLGLLTMAVLIGWLMFRSNRGPKRPSLISRSMGR